ncbi:enoyl-CoA hydratase-related protein [Streptococcus uberis]|uniref:enoyl-CoA hydratase/isomerase family protein n=1 Tax=Streptococcus uberis TaxID=1349 RepID=UPI001FF659A9|nr:enoyl-CoA hydratase-related protein [Streptococcus uberis]MCK1166244.1 enoyl-CoA hydratase-related protein [Streptococcus uberis]MCK1204308.1 enoyl-CoA hydratase-related protein [Streptococcus uberis]MCK1232154.1 enoyl-CoA hydratase-related protein [Streptococcus uberis]MCK1233747.1 enoyl-CoA hydratase-related protein [Streptococcus uberis]MCK1252019.1 enoyl-CoA hydratase-related protein [Streptococcus uberis]
MSVFNVAIKENVALVEYNNPPLNILTMENLKNLEQIILELNNQAEVSVIVFTMKMQGKVYCAGMDLDEMLASKEEVGGIESYCKVSKQYYSVFDRVEKPIIYVYDGIVRGGGVEMSFFADFRIAGEHINLALPEIGIGIIPGGGGTQTLARLIGEGSAKDLIMTGRSVKAEEMKLIGLVQRIFPSESLLEDALEFASNLAKYSPQALRSAKLSIHKGRQVDLYEGLALETAVFVDNFKTEDATEGITAFKEKRQPVFKNR